MSNMVLVSVFDHAVGEYAPCMCVNSEAAAIRIFTNEVNRYDPNNLLSTNKIDFSLYVVGEFDLSTGDVEDGYSGEKLFERLNDVFLVCVELYGLFP